MNIYKDKPIIFDKVSIIACRPTIKQTKKYKPQGFFYQKNLYLLNEKDQYVLANNMFTSNIKDDNKTYKSLNSFKDVSSLIL